MTADNRERECAHPLAGLAQVGDQREQCRHPEDHRKEVCELAKKPHGNRHARRTFDPIRAEFGETSSSLGGAEPDGVAAQALECGVWSELVDVHGADTRR